MEKLEKQNNTKEATKKDEIIDIAELPTDEFIEATKERLASYGYVISHNKLIKIQGNTEKIISGILPYITKKEIHSNGRDEEIKFIIKARDLETKEILPEIEMTNADYNSFKGITGTEWDRKSHHRTRGLSTFKTSNSNIG